MRKIFLGLLICWAASSTFGQTIQLTNGGSTSVSGATAASPISQYFQFLRFQTVYTAAELNAAGITGPKAVSQLGWYVSTAPANALPSYTIRMANTTATNSAAHNAAPLTQVFSGTYTPVAGGFDMINLNGAFVWDGTSNILVDVCYGPAVYATPYGAVRTYAATTSNGSRQVRCDNCGSQCGSNTTITNTFKPQVSFTFGAAPSCLVPGSLSVVPGSTTANLSWGSVPSATGYEWAVTTSNTPPASGTATSATTASATGLTAATNYFFHVRTNCGGTFSDWATLSFGTLCNPTNVPYTQNMDGVTAPVIPSCLIVENVNGSNTWGNLATPTAVVIGAPNSMVYAYNATTPADDWFFIQGLNLTGGTSYRLTFKWKSNPNFPERFEVKIGNAASAAAMGATALYNNTNAASSTVITETIDFTPPSSGVYFIGFHCYSLADQDFLSIDDITVDLSPSCPNPSGISVIPQSGSSANIAWNAVSGVLGYEWAVTTSATPPASGTATATNSGGPATGLTAGTSYFAHVRSACAGPTFSAWTSFPFGWIPNDSACGAVPLTLSGPEVCTNTTLATSLNDPTLPGSCSAPNNTVWFSYTPTSNGPVSLRATIPAASTNGLNGWVAWYTISSCPNPTFTVVPGSVCQSFGPAAGDADTLLSPNLTAGTTYYILIDGVSGDAGEACFNLLPPPPPPSCVTNISPANNATGIALTPSPTLTWNSTPGATSYSLFLGTVNPPTTNIGSTANTSTSVSGLAFSTTYFWYVVPSGLGGSAVNCAPNVTSFTTGAAPANCVPLTSSGCNLSDRLEIFRLKGETSELNISTGTFCSPTAYTDSTDHPVVIDLARGKTYWGQTKAGTTGDYLTVWIDDNDNGIFENDERLLNNLPMASTAAGNINLFVPLTTSVGQHRMRARLIYSLAAPTTVTDPCASFTYSDTKDFTVNIVAGGSPYVVSTYTPTGSCYTGGGAITIDSASNNNLGFVPLVDSSNAVIAQLYPEGNNLGQVTTSYYRHNGAVRQDVTGRYYLDRNITVNVTRQPLVPANLRLFFATTELNALIAQPGSGVVTVFDLAATKNDNPCQNAFGNNANASLLLPTGFGSVGGDRLLDFTGITSFSSFYLHGGTTPIPVVIRSFQAVRTQAGNELTWQVEDEVDVVKYELERSSDGVRFSLLTSLPVSGSTGNYRHVDAAPFAGNNYYRLKIIERAGDAKYSAIRKVINKGVVTLSLFPNPVKDKLQLDINTQQTEDGNLLILDGSGRTLVNQPVSGLRGNQRLTIETGKWAPGTYVVKLVLTHGNFVQTFIKQ